MVGTLTGIRLPDLPELLAELRIRCTQPLFSAPLVLVVPTGHPLAGVGRVTLAQLAGFPFVDSPPGFGNRIVVDGAFAAAGLEPEVTVEAPDVLTLADYIRRGLGIGFLIPPLIVDAAGLETLEIADEQPVWRMVIATSATRHPSEALEAFLSLLGELQPDPGQVDAASTSR